MEKNSPFLIVRFMSLTAVKSPNFLVTCSISMS